MRMAWEADAWPAGESDDADADLNFNGVVDVNDLLLVIGYWGTCP